VTGWPAPGYIQSAGLPLRSSGRTVIIIELGGGLLLVLGWKARWAAAALFVSLFLASIVFHAFWAAAPDQVYMQQIQFMKTRHHGWDALCRRLWLRSVEPREGELA
jgi:uncharacterized membrane protein YphA (DoxX/SURF4 family)